MAGDTIEATVPDDLKSVLEEQPESQAAWNALTAIGRRDYIGWINEAKLPETRRKRIERCAIDIAKGKRRPCCYAVVPMDLYKAVGGDPEAKAKWAALDGNEKRTFSEYIEASPDRAERKARVEETLGKLLAGHRAP